MKITNANYLSPNLRYDAAAQVVVFEWLNPDTGEVTFQVPSRATIRDEEHAAAIGATESAAPLPPAPAATDAAPAAGPQAQGSGVRSPRVSILV